MLLSDAPVSEDAPPRIVFFGGKGGVGKTTLAAAYAVGLAQAGARTLLLSTDPAHSLGDVFGAPLGDEPCEVRAGLWVRQPDAAAAVRRRIAQVTDDAYAAVPREIMPAVSRHLQHAAASPGMLESALADQLIEAMTQVPGRWDTLVVDSPPTGHLLRMIALPELLTPWVSGLAQQRRRSVRADRFATGVAGAGTGEQDQDDPLLALLHARRLRLETAARRLRSPEVQVRLVLVPRRMVLAETERAVQELRAGGIPLGPAVLNQVGAEASEEVVEAARSLFRGVGTPVVTVPVLDREPTGLPALGKLARML